MWVVIHSEDVTQPRPSPPCHFLAYCLHSCSCSNLLFCYPCLLSALASKNLNFYIHVINFVAWGLARLMDMKRSDGSRRSGESEKEEEGSDCSLNKYQWESCQLKIWSSFINNSIQIQWHIYGLHRKTWLSYSIKHSQKTWTLHMSEVWFWEDNGTRFHC